MEFSSRTWLANIALCLISYFAAVAAASAADLKMAPIIAVATIPVMVIISSWQGVTKNQDGDSKPWLSRKFSIPCGLLLAAIAVLPFNLSLIF